VSQHDRIILKHARGNVVELLLKFFLGLIVLIPVAILITWWQFKQENDLLALAGRTDSRKLEHKELVKSILNANVWDVPYAELKIDRTLIQAFAMRYEYEQNTKFFYGLFLTKDEQIKERQHLLLKLRP
jgi:hypothetical protein